jgi:predicted nucleic acid-binding protein
MAIILSADVVIRGEQGTFDLKSWVTSRRNDRFEIAAITAAELWHGVERATGADKVTRQRYLDAVLESLPIIPLHRADCVRACPYLGRIGGLGKNDWLL